MSISNYIKLASPTKPTELTGWRHFIFTLLLALAYFALGRAASLLAIPPGYSMAIYPAAGLALGATIIFEKRALPGVFFGSFLVNLHLSSQSFSQFSPITFVIPALLAGAVTLQAFAGNLLLMWQLERRFELDSEAKILQFFVFGGAISCLCASTIGVTCLSLAGVIANEDFLSNWAVWWLGDTFGVITITPLVLVFFAKPRDVWWSRRWTFLVPILISLALVFAAFSFTRQHEENKQIAEFQLKAERISQRLQAHLDVHNNLMHSLQSFFASSQEVSRNEFQTFLSYYLYNIHSIQSLAWSPRVTSARAEKFQQKIREEGFPSFRIHPFSGVLNTTAIDDYYPLTYIESREFSRQEMGLDLGSQLNLRKAIEKTRNTGQFSASAPIVEQTSVGRQVTVYLFAAIFNEDLMALGGDLKPKDFVGVCSTQIKMSTLISELINAEERDQMQIKFYDLHYPTPDTEFHNSLTKPSRFQYQSELKLADRRYQLAIHASPIYLNNNIPTISWFTIIGGLLFTTLLATYLLVNSAHSLQIARQIKQRTRELKESQERLQAIFDHAADGLLTASEYGLIETSNRSAQRLLGYQASQLQGKHLLAILQHPGTQNLLERIKKEGIALDYEQEIADRRIEITLFNKDNSEIAVELSIAKVQLVERPLLIVNMHDLSETKRTEKLKTEFVSAVSHELRTPLTSIRGILGLLLGGVAGKFPPKVTSMLTMANDNAIRLTNLVNDLLDFERLEYGSMQFYLDTINVYELVQKSVQSNLGYAQNFAIRLHFESLLHDEVWVMVDPKRFAQVLSNLISNAVKFSREKGQVEIRLVQESRQVRIEVEDHGIGISESFKVHIFQKFMQEDAKSTRKYAGTGLGLSLSKTLVEKMGGTIGFTSTEGSGSVFYVNLPIVKTAARTPSSTQE